MVRCQIGNSYNYAEIETTLSLDPSVDSNVHVHLSSYDSFSPVFAVSLSLCASAPVDLLMCRTTVVRAESGAVRAARVGRDPQT